MYTACRSRGFGYNQRVKKYVNVKNNEFHKTLPFLNSDYGVERFTMPMHTSILDLNLWISNRLGQASYFTFGTTNTLLHNA